MRRDRLTFGMIVGIPVVQLMLFGFAINGDPKHLPTAVLQADTSQYSRSLLAALKNSDYFRFVREVRSEAEAETALARGEVQFVVTIPENFSRSLLRGEKPTILVEADATDPSATGNAIASLRTLLNSALANDLKGPLAYLTGSDGPVNLRVHARYNPEGISQHNIVPGLMGVVLTMTMVMITGLAITRERERGTMENLLSMPTHPLEVLLGKIIPYIFVGYIQIGLILLAAKFVFHVPMVGSIPLLLLISLAFIAANLAMGITFSTLAKNQLQAMQMTFFYFLPNILLSGFMFPFQGMPAWARFIGNLLPLTYFNRLSRGIFLKGNGWWDLWPNIWPLMVFTVVVMAIAVKFYRRTLD
jgi:ABC-2 type transport system permease protein